MTVRIGIVDLMPSPGLAHRQFGQMVGVEVVALPLPPGGDLRDPVRCGLDWARMRTMDALIVTGTEPRTPRVQDDPMRGVIERVLEMGAISTVFSCFAAHAALSVLYPVERTGFEEKRRGVFAHRVAAPGHHLAAGLPTHPLVPHSRWNRVDVDGTDVDKVLVLEDGDWHLATSPDGLRHIFFQGHPEYDGDTLFREYRRDARRYLSGVSDRFPGLPASYLDDESVTRLLEFRERAMARRDPSVMDAFPTEGLIERCRKSWEEDARRVTGNWLAAIAA